MGVSTSTQKEKEKGKFGCGHIPSRGLAATNVGVGLLDLLAEAGRAVRVLLADGLAIRQVLCAVDDKHKCANDGAVDAEVGKDAGGVRPVEGIGLCLGRHCGCGGVRVCLLVGGRDHGAG